jgi:hypothetical protein
MNIKNTMCRLSDLTQEQVNNLVAAISESDYCQWELDDCLIGFYCYGDTRTWEGPENPTIVTYTEMMQLLKKTMKEFTKSDLKTGMFVKQREGMYMLVLEDRAVGNTGFTLLSDVRHNLLASAYKHLDIVAVYKASGDGVMTDYMEGNELTLIWERTEQTPAQKEMEVLQTKMDELQEQMKVVQAKL